jgi:hypothetical protein
MLKDKGLTGWFLGEAIVIVVYLLNRISCKAVEGKTPFEVWYRRRHAVHHLRTFGCVIYMKNTKPNLKKLEDRGRKMVFVGYEHGSKAYRAYDLVTGHVTIMRNLVFDESAQWDWARGDEGGGVNIDYLSDSFTVQYRVQHGEGGDDELGVEPMTPLIRGGG